MVDWVPAELEVARRAVSDYERGRCRHQRYHALEVEGGHPECPSLDYGSTLCDICASLLVSVDVEKRNGTTNCRQGKAYCYACRIDSEHNNVFR